jgi:phosphotransferase system enzyme I (PtsI)
MDDQEEIRLQGAPVSEGIAIGVPYFLGVLQEDSSLELPTTVSEVEEEIARYRRALFSSKEDLERLQTDLASEGSTDAVTIIDTHIQMLADPMITTDMEHKIREQRQNTESVFRTTIRDYEKRFSQISDSFFQQRLIDVLDVSKRILGHLNPKQKIKKDEIPHNSIVFAKELIPSDTASIEASRVTAFVAQTGGNSHAALIARAKGIPFVANVDLKRLQEAQGKCVIVDGETGDIILNPSSVTLKKYRERQAVLASQYQLLEKEAHLLSETQDGYSISLQANVGSVGDADSLVRYGAEGIGLFRTEYLYLQKQSFLYSEEEQFTAYAEVVKKAKGKPVVLRVFDIGGDKDLDVFRGSRDLNPFAECRGIRFLLSRKELFKTQLRAALRASHFGDLRILLPLVSDLKEIQDTKQLLAEIKKEFSKKGVPFAENIPLGAMIEVPAALIMCDQLAYASDFLSIGTNDLLQYTLGIDRNNPSMNDPCFSAHPAIIRMIKMAAIQAKRSGKTLSICGEIASNLLFVPLLIGLGVEQLSCAPRYLPVVKKMIRQCTLVECYALAERVLHLQTSREITQELLKAYRHIMPESN